MLPFDPWPEPPPRDTELAAWRRALRHGAPGPGPSPYPLNWSQISAAIRFGRAKGRCEGYLDAAGRVHPRPGRGLRRCETPHGLWIARRLEAPWVWRPAIGPSAAGVAEYLVAVYLSAAHLNHRPADCRPDNLRAYCQRCHLAYDNRDRRQRLRRHPRQLELCFDPVRQLLLPGSLAA